MAFSNVQDEKRHCQATPVRAAARLASEVLSSRQVKQSRDFDIPKRYGMHLFTSVRFFTLFKRSIYPQMAAEGCA